MRNCYQQRGFKHHALTVFTVLTVFKVFTDSLYSKAQWKSPKSVFESASSEFPCVYICKTRKCILKYLFLMFRFAIWRFFFTKEFGQKYKGKIDISVFCIFFIVIFDSKGSLLHRSICLIDTVLLIPILAYIMTLYVILHMS